MGQKVNPVGFRLGVLRTWNSKWFSDKNYSKLLLQDIQIRKYIQKHCSSAGVAGVVIERPAKKACVDIYASRPGILIGKSGTDLDNLKLKISDITGSDVIINVVNVRKPELSAYLVAESIAYQIEKRVSYRRAMKKAMQSAVRMGALGIKCSVSGRLGGAEIARTEWYRDGRVPLHTLRSDVDFSVGTARTTYGICGVKVWIYRGDREISGLFPKESRV